MGATIAWFLLPVCVHGAGEYVSLWAVMTNTSEYSAPSVLPVRIASALLFLLAVKALAPDSPAIEAKAHAMLSRLTSGFWTALIACANNFPRDERFPMFSAIGSLSAARRGPGEHLSPLTQDCVLG